MEYDPQSPMSRFQRRLENLKEEQALKPLTQPIPPPSKILFDGREFLDTPELHGMTVSEYTRTLDSIRTNMKVFMERRYSVVAEEHETSLVDAPAQLDNYLLVETLVRGFVRLPHTVHLYLLETVLSAWGFHYDMHRGEFRLPHREALLRIVEASGEHIPRHLVRNMVTPSNS